MDRALSLRKILTRLRGMNLCTSSARFAPSFVRQPNGPKCTQIVRNTPRHQFRVQWGGWVRSVRKIPTRLHSRTFALVRPVLHRDSYGNQMVPNAPKKYESHQNISLESNGVDRVRSLRKILTRLRGTNFCTSSARFAPRFVRQPNDPKCAQIV